MSPVDEICTRSIGSVPASVFVSSCWYRKTPPMPDTLLSTKFSLPKIPCSWLCVRLDENDLGKRKGDTTTLVTKGFLRGVAQPQPMFLTSIQTSPNVIAGAPPGG